MGAAGGPLPAEPGSAGTPAHTGGDGSSELVRAFAFARPDGEIWAAAWIPPGAAGTAMLGVGPEARTAPLRLLEGERPQEPWRMEAEGAELTLQGVADPVQGEAERPAGGFDQLCHVTGRLSGTDNGQSLALLGWRSARPLPESGSVDSLRQVAAWFDPDNGFAVLALRPRGAKGQDRDQISGALFEPGHSRPVAEPRLSSTYTDAGHLIRAGVELWIESEGESDELYPRRAAGEAMGPPARWTAEGLALEAQPFHWHSGGREGAGVYLLARS